MSKFKKRVNWGRCFSMLYISYCRITIVGCFVLLSLW